MQMQRKREKGQTEQHNFFREKITKDPCFEGSSRMLVFWPMRGLKKQNFRQDFLFDLWVLKLVREKSSAPSRIKTCFRNQILSLQREQK